MKRWLVALALGCLTFAGCMTPENLEPDSPVYKEGDDDPPTKGGGKLSSDFEVTAPDGVVVMKEGDDDPPTSGGGKVMVSDVKSGSPSASKEGDDDPPTSGGGKSISGEGKPFVELTHKEGDDDPPTNGGG